MAENFKLNLRSPLIVSSVIIAPNRTNHRDFPPPLPNLCSSRPGAYGFGTVVSISGLPVKLCGP